MIALEYNVSLFDSLYSLIRNTYTQNCPLLRSCLTHELFVLVKILILVARQNYNVKHGLEKYLVIPMWSAPQRTIRLDTDINILTDDGLHFKCCEKEASGHGDNNFTRISKPQTRFSTREYICEG